MMVPLNWVLGIAAVILLLALEYYWVEKLAASARRMEAASAEVRSALNDLAEQTQGLREKLEPLAALPRMMESIAKIGTAQLELLQQQKVGHPFGKPTGPMPPRDVAGANMEDEVTRLMRAEGIGREEALLRINPANAASVWEGNAMFDGWR